MEKRESTKKGGQEMSSKEEILAKIRMHTQQRYAKPDWTINALTYEDKREQFCQMTRAVGGEAVFLDEGEDLNALIRQRYPGATRIASVLPEVTCATFNPDQAARPQDLDGTDVAVVQGEIGVAENATVWIPQTVKYKAIYFIAEALVILLDKERIVDTMHDAYKQLEQENYEFGTFISGPSKTADIEQALVMGAHGARDVLVILR